MVLIGGMRGAAAVLTALAFACCGGGSNTTPTRSSPGAVDPASLVQLDAANFEPLVLASASPGVVEFHSPT